ncbi:MerR family transcriptional regulator [Pseudonocardia sp. ICBG1122]|nr:MerR family transcriptional regulator [Pseudonocardia pini]
MASYRISEFAERVGIPATALRYYESQGLLQTRRTPGGYRAYDNHDEERVRFIAAAKALNLPLRRIRALLDVWQDGMCRDVRLRLLPLVAEQIVDLDKRLDVLHELRRHLVEAQRRLHALPSRDSPCSPDCAFLSPAPTLPDDAPYPPSASAVAIACSLAPEDHAARLARWHAALAGTTPDYLDDGSVRVEIPRPRTTTIVALLHEETDCCPFLRFTLTITHDGIRLDATAPVAARPLLSELFHHDTMESDLC